MEGMDMVVKLPVGLYQRALYRHLQLKLADETGLRLL